MTVNLHRVNFAILSNRCFMLMFTWSDNALTLSMQILHTLLYHVGQWSLSVSYDTLSETAGASFV